MAKYSEEELEARLWRLDQFQRTAFVAACAERPWPLFERCVRVTGQGDVGVLRRILDMAWSAAEEVEVEGMPGAQEAAEAMVPTDDGEWVFEMGYGQNAAAAVAYAVRTWLADDPQEAVWGARQLYEAADCAAQQSLAGWDVDAGGTESSLFRSRAVQSALEGLSADLVEVESSGSRDWSALRARACEEGETWARILP